MDELSEEDKLTVSIGGYPNGSISSCHHLQQVERARKIQRFMSQPFQVAQVFTGIEGRLVPLKDTIRSFKEILSGQHDSLPESAFYMVCSLPRPAVMIQC